MRAKCRNVLVLLAAFWRQAPRCAAGPPIHPARPPCASESLTSRRSAGRVRARKDALLGLVAATGRLCDAARGDEDVESELADVLRALTEVAAERDVPLDALARRIDAS